MWIIHTEHIVQMYFTVGLFSAAAVRLFNHYVDQNNSSDTDILSLYLRGCHQPLFGGFPGTYGWEETPW